MPFTISWRAATEYDADLDALEGCIQFRLGEYQYGDLLPDLPMTHSNLVVWKNNLKHVSDLLLTGKSASIVDVESAGNWIVFIPQGPSVTVKHVHEDLPSSTSIVRDAEVQGQCMAQVASTKGQVLKSIEDFISGVDAEVGKRNTSH